MSVPVVPIEFYVYKMMKENEITGRTFYSKQELLNFANKTLKKASEMHNADYWAITQNEYAEEIDESLLKICDVTTNYYEINENKLKNGGMQWARKVIGLMPYSFLKGAVQVLDEELKEKTGGITCD